MHQLQYDSLYKFMVSAGIALVVAPIALLIFLVSGRDDLLISQDEMSSLCAESAELVHRRFTYLSFLYKYTFAICLILFVIGFILIALGCIKWWGIQKKLDKRTSLELDEISIRIKKMTPPEVNKKAAVEVNQTIADSIKFDKNLIEKGKQYTEAILKYLEVEDKCFITIKNESKDRYIVKQNVSVRDENIDIVAVAKDDKVDLIYEVKYWEETPSLALISKAIRNLAKKKDTYEEYMGRKVKPILMVATVKDSLDLMNSIIGKEVNNSFVEIRIEDVAALC